MTRLAWRIATDTPDYTADDRSGEGARRTGGRWNAPGTPMLYATDSQALACLETIVHLAAGGLPLNRYLVRFDIPDAVWRRRSEADSAALVGWDALPTGRVSIHYGTAWATSQVSAVLVVPSVIVPDERAILLNPQHPDFAAISLHKLRRWTYDPRLLR